MKKGFTLLELLVVVLIIGILAAIALPQYKLAVERSRYNSVKNAANSIHQAQQRYYLLHSTYPTDLNNLDIVLPNNSNCYIGGNINRMYVGCKISKLNYFIDLHDNQIFRYCVAYTIDKTDIYNKICADETKNNSPSSNGAQYDYIYKT